MDPVLHHAWASEPTNDAAACEAGACDTCIAGSVSQQLTMLIVEDNAGDALLVRRCLTSGMGTHTRFTQVATLCAARAALRAQRFDAVLVDLGLPDARGPEVIEQLCDAAPSTPAVVISGDSDERVALEAVRRGAQDYVPKHLLAGGALCRSVRYAIERSRHDAQLKRLAHFDDLTGLANRSLFSERLTHAIERAHRSGTHLAVMFVDVDRFKAVNDALGHAMGDRLLQLIATRIESALRHSDTVALLHGTATATGSSAARVGGDEFAILLENVADRQAAQRVAERLLMELRSPVALQDVLSSPTASIGIAIYPEDGTTREALLASADAAMYRAKQRGRDSCHGTS